MKKLLIYSAIITTGVFWTVGCSESFLDQPPKGAYSSSSLANLTGVEGLLIGAYSGLDGSWFESWDNNHFNQNGGASNWIWGSVRAEDAYKGTEPTDGVDISPIERFETQPNNPVLLNKWNASYDGIGRVNDCLRTLAIAEDISEEDAKRISGEARFLRAHYHFEVLKAFKNPPYVDETVLPGQFQDLTNSGSIYPQIEADLQYAFDNLPEVQIAPGRANKWAAGAYLAKIYIFQAKWSQAKSMLDQVIQNGMTASGVPYALLAKFSDNFDAAQETASNSESIFAYEASVNDGSFANGNYENSLNQPHGSSIGAGCCGFFQPTQNLVNSYKVDASGLPLLDTFNDSDVKSDEGLAPAPADGPDPFVPYTGTLDPRLDWTVGRRGIPYLDWGKHPGSNWIRQVPNGGPYSPMKDVPRVRDFEGSNAGVFDWGFTLSALNVHIIRYADVILWAAEAEAELGNLDKATEYVNMIRTRAANSADFVMDGASPAANYLIGNYPTFSDQEEALKAIRFERKLELAMEGHRFFDEVRWQEATDAGLTALPFDMVTYINNYLTHEAIKRQHLSNADFEKRYMYMPIPQYVITQSTVNGEQNIVQNTGFN